MKKGTNSGIWAMVAYRLRKWCTTPRMYILLLFMIFIEDLHLFEVRNFSIESGVPVTIFSLPLMIVYPYFDMMFMFGILLLFGDAPFMERAQIYQITRAGRTRWAVAQIFYTFLASLMYCLMAVVLSIILLLPHITLENDWGKIYNTLAQTNMGSKIGMKFPISYHVILEYRPWEALGLMILIGTLVAFFTGLLMFAGSIWFSKNVGIALASYVPISVIGLELSNGILWYFTPAAWMNLEVISWQSNRVSPTIPRVILILTAGIVLLGILVVKRVQKMDIPVLQDV